MSDWLKLDCPFCRTHFRIKAEYGHMKGRCPECGFRIAPPVPIESAPLPVSDSEEPLGLLPLDDADEWPEPALKLLEETDPGEAYRFRDDAIPAAQPLPQGPSRSSTEDEEVGGIYALASEPTETPAARPAQAVPVAASVPVAAPPTASAEVDPLFLDEWKPAPAAASAPVAVPVPTATAVPVANVAKEVPAAAAEKPKKNLSPAAEQAMSDPNSEIYKLSNAEYNPEREEPLPDDIYFRGVWSLPFSGTGFGPWFWISLGVTVLVLQLLMMQALQGAGRMGILGMAPLGIGIGWIFVWTFAFAAECLFCIVSDTANGSPQIHWPEGGWREWFWSLPRLLWLKVISVGIASFFTFLTQGLFGIPGFVVVEAMVFPAVLISSLANEWSLVPLNGQVFASIGTKIRYWATYWLLVGVLWIAVEVIAHLTMEWWFLAPVIGGAFSYAWLVQARLCGRLARVITEVDEPTRKKRRKRRKKAAEEVPATSGWGGEEPAPAKKTKSKAEAIEKNLV